MIFLITQKLINIIKLLKVMVLTLLQNNWSNLYYRKNLCSRILQFLTSSFSKYDLSKSLVNNISLKDIVMVPSQ